MTTLDWVKALSGWLLVGGLALFFWHYGLPDLRDDEPERPIYRGQ
jgi:hypothetical protein